MFLFEKTYDIDEIVKNNTHTHTNFSRCASAEMTLIDMIKVSENAGMSTLAITDHSNLDDGIDLLADTLELRRQLSEIETPVKVLIGSELSCYGIDKYSEPTEICDQLDYRNYSCNHFHLKYWDQPEDRSPRGYAEHLLKVMYTLINSGRADCIAHPFTPSKMKFFDTEERLKYLNSFTDNEIGDIMEAAEKAECAWEFHSRSFISFPDFFRKFYFIGKEVGVHFNFGTDAHHLGELSSTQFAEIIKNILF